MVAQTITFEHTTSNQPESHSCMSPFRAVKLGHAQCLQNFTQSQLSEVDGDGQSILHLAARMGDMQCTKFVIDNVPSLLDVENSCSETPLLTAVGYGHQNLVELMLDGPLKEAQRRALHRDVNGTTCLMAAVAQRDNDLALWLLRRFGKPLASQFNACKMLPVHVAAANGNVEFIRIVTKYDSHMVNFKDQMYTSHLCRTRWLLVQSSLHGRETALRSLSGHAHIAKWLIGRAGSEAMLHTTHHQANSVHCAAFAGHLPVLRVFLEPWSRKKRRQLLTLKDARGNTPFHLAAISNHIEVAQYLLDTGANPKLLNNSEQSAEDIAHIRKCFALAQLIRNHSCNRNKRVKSAKSCTDLNQTLTLDRNVVTGRFSAPQSFPMRTAPAFPIKHFSSNIYAQPHPIQKLITAEMHLHRGRQQSVSDESTQTEVDLLLEKVKIIDDSWIGEATAAVEEIDKVLVSEIEV
ncbi:hypothetical protein QR680_003047 [Steinernema hermaphroditum]|uniref:ANK_REP_REGION domain-containing protein n=1 Tax=Steinernema hermaphroditum TaxID=289476 RepID=A0AA39LIZ3_9BILA|nr:hypothetical protein QR680_003047 [Steinernema hermaphroditum]